MAIQTMQQDGGLGDINKLLELVKDQKTTTSTVSNLTDAGATAQINNILGSVNGLASVAGAQHSAGFYNGTVNTQLINDLLTRTAAQVQANKAGTTTTQTKKAPVNKSQAALALVSTALKSSSALKAAYKNLTTPNGVSNAEVDKALADPNVAANTNDLAGFTTADSTAASEGDLSGVATSGSTSGADLSTAIGNILSDGGFTNESVNAALSGTTASTADVAGLTALDSTAASGGETAAAAGTTDVAGLTALDSAAASEGGSAVVSGTSDAAATTAAADMNPYVAAAVAIPNIYKDFKSGDVTQSVGDFLGGSTTGDLAGAAKGWIVCTELVKQNRMPRKYYVPGLRVFQFYRLDLLDGYYVWARPTVTLLQEEPFCLRSRFVAWLFNHRAEYLASRVGVAGARDTVIGQVISAAVYGFCWTLGQYLKHTRKPAQGEFV